MCSRYDPREGRVGTGGGGVRERSTTTMARVMGGGGRVAEVGAVRSLREGARGSMIQTTLNIGSD